MCKQIIGIVTNMLDYNTVEDEFELQLHSVQSSGAVEYANCISAEG